MAEKGSPLRRQCAAIDGGRRCPCNARFTLSQELAKLARKSSAKGFGADSSLAFDIRGDECMVCADHAMDTIGNAFHRGLSDRKKLSIETLLMDTSVWLADTDRGLSAEEVENLSLIHI